MLVDVSVHKSQEECGICTVLNERTVTFDGTIVSVVVPACRQQQTTGLLFYSDLFFFIGVCVSNLKLDDWMNKMRRFPVFLSNSICHK